MKFAALAALTVMGTQAAPSTKCMSCKLKDSASSFLYSYSYCKSMWWYNTINMCSSVRFQFRNRKRSMGSTIWTMGNSWSGASIYIHSFLHWKLFIISNAYRRLLCWCVLWFRLYWWRFLDIYYRCFLCNEYYFHYSDCWSYLLFLNGWWEYLCKFWYN